MRLKDVMQLPRVTQKVTELEFNSGLYAPKPVDLCMMLPSLPSTSARLLLFLDNVTCLFLGASKPCNIIFRNSSNALPSCEPFSHNNNFILGTHQVELDLSA